MSNIYAGLISGTSLDGVDVVIAEFGDRDCRIAAARTIAYPRRIAARLKALIESPQSTLSEIGSVNVAVGRFFADCALAVLREAGVEAAAVAAIGHHGQTVYHQPDGPEPFSMQLGDASSIAAITGIATVADFRNIDIALGGQGAPLVPAFHEWLFATRDAPRIIVNIGGIANLTVLVPGEPTLGFDTGPGNTLLDLWISRCKQQNYDDGGHWAAAGQVDTELLSRLLREPYFELDPPKSTGRELFNWAWLEGRLESSPGARTDADVQATLAELTAVTLAQALARLGHADYELIVCGGGSHNEYLLGRIGACTGRDVKTTTSYGIDPDWVEGAAFAWLARARISGNAGNVPTVTGARKSAILGGLYCGDNT